jgi:hypothetical protein
MDNSLKSFAQRTVPGTVFALAMLSAFPAVAAQSEAISIDLEVLPAAKRYVELAAYPSFLAIAWQVNGFSPNQAGRVVIEDARKLRFNRAGLSFIRQDKGVYYYRGTLDWSADIVQSKFELPVEADLSRAGDGKIAIRVYPPLAQYFPQQLTDKIRLKVQSIATPAAQRGC